MVWRDHIVTLHISLKDVSSAYCQLSRVCPSVSSTDNVISTHLTVSHIFLADMQNIFVTWHATLMHSRYWDHLNAKKEKVSAKIAGLAFQYSDQNCVEDKKRLVVLGLHKFKFMLIIPGEYVPCSASHARYNGVKGVRPSYQSALSFISVVQWWHSILEHRA